VSILEIVSNEAISDSVAMLSQFCPDKYRT
jgi:hypothetical protein